MKKLILIIVFATILGNFCKAQTVVASSGNYNQGTNATLSWTLGEPITETSVGSNSILNSGMQQTYSFTIVNVFEKPNVNVKISVYPNPAVDFLNIAIENSNEPYEISIFDLNGRILISKKMNASISSFDVKKFAESNYFLKVSNQKGEVIKTYKIVKSHE